MPMGSPIIGETKAEIAPPVTQPNKNPLPADTSAPIIPSGTFDFTSTITIITRTINPTTCNVENSLL